MFKARLVFVVVALGILTSGLLWFASQGPTSGRDAAAAQMEKDSASWFHTENDVGRLAQDFKAEKTVAVGVAPDYALVTLVDGSKYYVRLGAQRSAVIELLKEQLLNPRHKVVSLGDIEAPSSVLSKATKAIFTSSMLSVLLVMLVAGVMLMQISPMGAGVGRFKETQPPQTRFGDVIGAEEAKEALQDIVAYLREPAKFAAIGANPPHGVTLVGPPGTGKTLLARALAGESKVRFLALNGSDFTDKFLGVGVARVKALFKKARKLAPCVVFIDEIDGIGRRSNGSGPTETENNRIINALLGELDGFTPSSGVIVVGATNHLDNIDPALLREGRFDRICTVTPPDIDEREALFQLYGKKVQLAAEVDVRQLARRSTGLSPAGVANIINTGAVLAAKEGCITVTQSHLLRALELIQLGAPSTGLHAAMSEEERRRIAVHEAGHALIAKLLNVGVVEKVTIIPRGRALGVTLITDERERPIRSEPELQAHLEMLLGGRAAEALLLGNISSGASSDLERASSMAYRMVAEFGFSEKLGAFSLAGLPRSEQHTPVQQEVVGEARALLAAADERCGRRLSEHRVALGLLVNALMEQETVPGETVTACLEAAPTQQTAAILEGFLGEAAGRAELLPA